MWATLLLLIYSVAVLAASLLGGWLPIVVRLTHVRMQMAMSFVAGLMLGVGILHLLPHAVVQFKGPGAVDQAVGWALAGLLAMFFLIRAFDFHQHASVAPAEPAACDHDHDHGPNDPHAHVHPATAHFGAGAHRASWWAVAVGLSLHTLIDGVALAAAVQADAAGGHGTWLLGLGAFLAILLHKPLDALSITSLMTVGGWSIRARQIVNGGFALMCPLGALAFNFGVPQLAGQQQVIVGAALAFSAGAFLCISLGDLLPELQFHTHDRLKLSTALLLGVVLAWMIGVFEPAHLHGHDHGAEIHQHSDDQPHDGPRDHPHNHSHDHPHDHPH